MEPIEGVETIPKGRWKLVCSICRIKGGACIQCDNKSCFTAFHVTCARAHGNLGSMKALLVDGKLKAHCNRHMPVSAFFQTRMLQRFPFSKRFSECKAERLDGLQGQSEDETSLQPHKKALKSRKPPRKTSHLEEASSAAHVPELAKTARAHARKYTSGPPLVPAMIVNRLLDYVQKAKLRKLKECIERICRYWSLKREARRGAPLLKRLYLEVSLHFLTIMQSYAYFPHNRNLSRGQLQMLPKARPMQKR